MEFICYLLLPHIVIGAILGLGERQIVKAAPHFAWILPMTVFAVWIAMLIIGSHNNPNGKGLLFLFLGCPSFLAWGIGLFLGWSGAAGKEK